MKKTLLLLCTSALMVACAAKQTDSLNATVQVSTVSGIDLTNMDKSVRAQDDFYHHINGKWLKEFEIPADKSNYGSFLALSELSREQVKEIIDDVSSKRNKTGSDEQKIADLYNAYLDTKSIEKAGLAPIVPLLNQIDAIANRQDLAAYWGYADIYTSSPFGLFVMVDQKQSDRYITYLNQSGLGLPDRDYYFKTDDKSQQIRDQYVQHIERMFELAGDSAAADKAQQVMALETRLAEGHWNRIDNRDSEKTYNIYSFTDAKNLMPDFPWQAWLSETLIAEPSEIIVRQPDYLQTINNEFKNTPLDVWKTYQRWKLLTRAANFLSSDFEKENFSFYGTVLTGATEQEPRWKRGVDTVNNVMGELIGKVYVKRHFPPSAKTRMRNMIEQLREAYGDSIKELDWMSHETKEKALVKLAKFEPKVGYPDVWRDYSALQITDQGLVPNMLGATHFITKRNRDKLGQPIDRHEWFMNPQTVNAYYNPTKNEIVFPAGILQPPFFNLQADEAVNYGAIGAVIGHEMGHGFDDQGSKYDGDGNLKNWWTDADREKFEQRTAKLIEQYDQFTVVNGTHVKGEFTQGENIGDLSGLSIAYKAFKSNYTGNEVIDGYTPEQRFFIGWAQVWMRKYRDEELLRRIEVDPHSPSEFRCNGILRNLPEFYQAFDVKPGDGMYLPPDERVKIW